MQVVPGVLGPLLETDLHISQATLGLLGAAAIGGMSLGMLPGGLLTDRFGERPIMSIGVVGAGLMMLAASTVSSPNLLVVLFLASSIGAAFAATGGPKTIIRWFAPNRRGTAMGIRQTGMPLGGLLASLLLPSIAIATDWRFALRCAASVAIVGAGLFYLIYRDPAGSAAPEQPRGRHSIFLSRRFLAATGCAVTLQAAQACTLTYLPVDVHQLLGLPTVTAALFLAIALIGGVAGRIGWGTAGDLIGNRRALSGVSSLAAVCCLVMSTLSPNTNLVVVAFACLALGLTTTSWNAVYISLVTAMAPDRSTAASLGVGLTAVLLGFLFAPAFGFVADVSNSFRPSWIALAVFLIVGVGLSIVAKPAPVRPAR